MLLIVLAARYGVEAFAVAFVTTYVLVWPFRLRYLTRLARISTLQYAFAFVGPAFIALAMMAIMMVWRGSYAQHLPWLVDLATSVLVGVVAYAALCWFLLRNRVVRSTRLFLAHKQAQLTIAPARDRPEHLSRGRRYGASDAIRWAFAMTENVIVVAGIDGSTDASTM